MYLSVLYPLGGSLASLQDPSVVPDPLMGPMGFVIRDVYIIVRKKNGGTAEGKAMYCLYYLWDV